jgi:hypothetical protein
MTVSNSMRVKPAVWFLAGRRMGGVNGFWEKVRLKIA